MVNRKLTIGMAMYDDFQGVYFTVQDLRIHHREAMKQCELVVVDNNPGPNNRHSGKVKQLLSSIWEMPVRYMELPEPKGTSAPRQAVFDAAQTEYVMCIDCHVLFLPRAIEELLAYYDSNPNTKNLYSGPIIWDTLRPPQMQATHFDNTWGGEMWGRWSNGWIGPDNKFYTVQRVTTGEIVPMLPLDSAPLPKDQWPLNWPMVPFENHEEVLQRNGYRYAACLGLEENPTCEPLPFEIPAMGLGVFTCRKDAWLGFNPKFRGFGGEEWYIHTKFRKAGHKCMCLPFLRWIHRFSDGEFPYKATHWDKIRNYVIGHTELGIPLDSIKREFYDKGLIPSDEWNDLLNNPLDPPIMPSRFNNPAPAPGGSQRQPCGACPGSAAQAQAQLQNGFSDMSLEDMYRNAHDQASEINVHTTKLRELASEAGTVIELGVRPKLSTIALLAGQPKRLLVYAPGEEPIMKALKEKQGRTDFQFAAQNPLDIPECDLLFINTRHTADQLWSELTRYAPRVHRRIVLFATQLFAERGEDGTSAGMFPALRKYLKENQQWSVIYHTDDNNGLTVISKDPADKPELPPIGKQMLNFVAAKAKMLWKSGETKGTPVSDEVAGKRLDICALCPQRSGERCTKCGCYLTVVPEGQPMAGHPGRAMIAEMQCPLGRWFEEKEGQNG
jgi:hypothetical protein